jgi:hypothetical protein
VTPYTVSVPRPGEREPYDVSPEFRELLANFIARNDELLKRLADATTDFI